MWQSLVEIEHYSVRISIGLMHSKRSSAELPLRVGLIRFVSSSMLAIFTQCMSPTLNRSSALQRFERSNVIEIHNGMFDFYAGLPHMYIYQCGHSMNVVGKYLILHLHRFSDNLTCQNKLLS